MGRGERNHMKKENNFLDLMGEIDEKYEDEDTELVMLNNPSSNWKDMLGDDLMRFQSEDTKLLVKEEIPVIKIQNKKGRFLEQGNSAIARAQEQLSCLSPLLSWSISNAIDWLLRRPNLVPAAGWLNRSPQLPAVHLGSIAASSLIPIRPKARC